MSESKNPEHTGSSFGTPTPDPEAGLFGPPVKLNAVTAARPMPQPVAAPAPVPPAPRHLATDYVPEHMRVPAGHPPITDHFGGFNRYVGAKSITLNEFGGLDIGLGGPDGEIQTGRMVHIHTAMVINVE